MTSIASGRSSRRWGRCPPLESGEGDQRAGGGGTLRRASRATSPAMRGGAAHSTRSPARANGSRTRCGRRTASRPELDRQPVDQPGHVALARRLLDQAVLRGAQRLGPVGGQREGVEPESGFSAAALFGEQPLRCFGSRLAIAVATEAMPTLPSTRRRTRSRQGRRVDNDQNRLAVVRQQSIYIRWSRRILVEGYVRCRRTCTRRGCSSGVLRRRHCVLGDSVRGLAIDLAVPTV